MTAEPAEPSLDPKLLARAGHGAVQIDLPTRKPLKVMLAGPIKVWWEPGQWDTTLHQAYVRWRDAVRVVCVRAGFLVYSPHRAWQGAWHEDAQRVNDEAIRMSDVMIDLSPPDIPRAGTDAEATLAESVGTAVLSAPPGDAAAMRRLLDELHRHDERTHNSVEPAS
ncbi:MAG: hypothetical protein ACR2F6_04230 [Mycobacteriales bacterium]